MGLRCLDTIASTAIALRTPAREHTFGELRERAGWLTSRLHELGLGGGDRVAIASGDHATIISSVLAILDAGCVFAPASEERLLARLGVKAVVRDGETVDVRDGAPALPAEASSIYFTSGSTGAPRAIVGRRAGIDHHLDWEIDFLGLDATVRGAIIHASSYDAYLCDVFVPMCSGGVACAPAERDVVLEPARLCAWLASEGITLLHCVPSLFRSLLPLIERTSLRYVLLAGEVVRPADVRAARRVLGDVRLVNLYGPTEATFVKLHHEIGDDDDEVPIGLPMPGVTVHLLDGQIAIQSPYGSLGYLDEPELTRERFLEAPNGEQIYLTGDYGRQRADGKFLFDGRRDRQIKLYGARVDLDEIEAILGEHPGVVDSAVVAQESVLRGFVVLAEGTSIAAVREHAMKRLPPSARLAWLTKIEAMPRTPSGKIDRKQLEARSGEAREVSP